MVAPSLQTGERCGAEGSACNEREPVSGLRDFSLFQNQETFEELCLFVGRSEVLLSWTSKPRHATILAPSPDCGGDLGGPVIISLAAGAHPRTHGRIRTEKSHCDGRFVRFLFLREKSELRPTRTSLRKCGSKESVQGTLGEASGSLEKASSVQATIHEKG